MRIRHPQAQLPRRHTRPVSDDDEDDADGKGKNGVFDLNPNLKQLDRKLVIPADGYPRACQWMQIKPSLLQMCENRTGRLTHSLQTLQYQGASRCRSRQTIWITSSVTADRSAWSTQTLLLRPVAERMSQKVPRMLLILQVTRLATTNAYAAGAVIISEVMWGLDAGGKGSQYIELHNTGQLQQSSGLITWNGRLLSVVRQHLGSLPLIRSTTIRLPATGQCRVAVV